MAEIFSGVRPEELPKVEEFFEAMDYFPMKELVIIEHF